MLFNLRNGFQRHATQTGRFPDHVHCCMEAVRSSTPYTGSEASDIPFGIKNPGVDAIVSLIILFSFIYYFYYYYYCCCF